MNYAIKDTTLTALGDAVRTHLPEYEGTISYGIHQLITSKTYISYDKLTNTMEVYSYPTNTLDDSGQYLQVISIPGAASIKVFAAWRSNKHQYLGFWPGDMTGQGWLTEYGRLPAQERNSPTYSANTTFGYGDTMTVGWRTYGETAGLYLEAIGLDADGNELPDKNIIVTHTAMVKDKMTPLEMAETISNFDTVPADAYYFTGDLSGCFSGNKWAWFVNQYGEKIITENIIDVYCMFQGSDKITNIPFTINCNNSYLLTVDGVFADCNNLEHIEPFGFVNVGGIPSCFRNCHYLTTEEIENVFANASYDWLNNEKPNNGYAGELVGAFKGCYSMRRLPMNLIRNIFNPMADGWPSLYNGGFADCVTLDEAVDIPVADQAEWQEDVLCNMFGNHCDRLKEFTFETNDDGTPKTARWAYQNLKCDRIGYGYGVGAKGVGSLYELYKWNKNCGITGDDRVVDESSYNQLKDSENWWSNFEEYSRYNHDSAVNTINSLPDCSAYIEEIGDGTNTITFRAEVGSATDGGAVGNLTEEEIAVAAAKGWTVSLW